MDRGVALNMTRKLPALAKGGAVRVAFVKDANDRGFAQSVGAVRPRRIEANRPNLPAEAVA